MKKITFLFYAIALSAFQFNANASVVELSFDAKFTYGVFHTPSSMTMPLDTSLSFSFDLSSDLPTTTYPGTTSKKIFSDARAVIADSPIFDQLPAPNINWDAGPPDSSVAIQRNESTGMYRLLATKSLSYSLNCILQCTHYFKAISIVSDYVTATDHDPFSDPLHFIQSLQLSRTVFESTVVQDSWQRLSRRDVYAGASLSTSIDTIGYGSRWQGGGAWLTNATSPVPEPSAIAMAFSALLVLAASKKLSRGA